MISRICAQTYPRIQNLRHRVSFCPPCHSDGELLSIPTTKDGTMHSHFSRPLTLLHLLRPHPPDPLPPPLTPAPAPIESSSPISFSRHTGIYSFLARAPLSVFTYRSPYFTFSQVFFRPRHADRVPWPVSLEALQCQLFTLARYLARREFSGRLSLLGAPLLRGCLAQWGWNKNEWCINLM